MRGGYTYSLYTDADDVIVNTSAYTNQTSTFAIKNQSGTDVSGTSTKINQLQNIADSNSTEQTQTTGNFVVNGSVGIGTNSPDRILDVHGAARPSGYPFAIGGTATNRARYVAVEVNPGNNKTLITKDFILGGSRRPGWVRVHAGAASADTGSLQYAYYAEFTISTNGTTVYSNRQTGDTAITIVSNNQTNGFRVSITSGSTNGSYPRAWIEVYSETEVYW